LAGAERHRPQLSCGSNYAERVTVDRFRDWFWRPPRAHGDVVRDRVVSPVELLYDLVYVAAISQAAHQLAVEISTQRLIEFGVVFSMIWLAWINGSLYLELHGRDDGRTRSYVFIQIGILVLLAVFTANAATTHGAQFAIVYAAFLAVMTWLWQSVRYQDTPEFIAITRRYVLVMLASTVTILASAFLAPDVRLIVWSVFALLFIGFFGALGFTQTFGRGVTPTHSMAERFGLFTIIVLGEVVIGVVDGLSHAEQDALTIATGMIALGIGLGFWWVYFDIIGNRVPRNTSRSTVAWTLLHLPITLSIAAAGAGMVGLIEHAHDAHTPSTTAWLISGSVAMALVSVIAAAWTLVVFDRLASVYRRLAVAMSVAALAALGLGYIAPAPWLLASGLGIILTITWLLTVRWHIRARAWPPHALETPHAPETRAAEPIDTRPASNQP
jgi:low temperature requirement protein LtrA